MRQSRRLMLGNVPVGGGAPVTVQSMTTTDTRDSAATLAQIQALHEVGCDIVRVAVPDRAAVAALAEIAADSPIPVVADIHFSCALALAAIAAGAHAIRINPGNLRPRRRVPEVADELARTGIPVRVGVNLGSITPELRRAFGGDRAGALVEDARRCCDLLETRGVTAIKVSLKAADVPTTVAACRRFAAMTDYPLHLGVTEAGTPFRGTIKSAAGIAALLLDGIGDTVRVSLTAPPHEEVKVAIAILETVGCRQARPEIVSCPTCGRTEIDLFALTAAVETEVARIKAAGGTVNLDRIAVMGCAVNGPGEARDADLGIAGGRAEGVLFRKGRIAGTFPADMLLAVLLKAIRAESTPGPAAGNSTK